MTDAPADILALAADFPPATREQWLALVAGLRKGAPFARRLVAKTADGLSIQPLYGGNPQAPALAGRRPGAWQILQRVDHPGPAAAAVEARHDPDNGATGLSLVLAGAVGAYGYGVAAGAETIMRALEDIALDAPGLALDLDGGAQGEGGALSLVSVAS